MSYFVSLTVAFIAGFLLHSAAMKVSFKQRTIDNKIKVYDALIVQWVRMRNFIYANHPGQSRDDVPVEIIQKFDLMYGESQKYIGETILVCENTTLTDDINELNGRIYFTKWHRLPIEQVNETMEQIKVEAIAVISRMRHDVKDSTRFEWQDLVHIFSGFRRKKTNS